MRRDIMPKLTKSQQKIYDYLLSRRDEGIPPTVREIRDATGFKSTSTIQAHLNTLERLGLISKQPGHMRSVSLGERSHRDGICVPMAASFENGEPVYTYDENVVADSALKHGRELFAFRITDDSMKNAGILTGDIVIAARGTYAENGEITVCFSGGRAEIRRFYRDDGYFRLVPENPDYEPIITETVRILGKVISIVRNYE